MSEVAERFADTLPEGARIDMQRPFIDSIWMEVETTQPIVELMREVCEVFGKPTAVKGVPFGSDCTKLTRAGSPTVVFGPGSIEQAHTADEHVRLADVATAAAMLVGAARRAAGRGR